MNRGRHVPSSLGLALGLLVLILTLKQKMVSLYTAEYVSASDVCLKATFFRGQFLCEPKGFLATLVSAVLKMLGQSK